MKLNNLFLKQSFSLYLINYKEFEIFPPQLYMQKINYHERKILYM